MKLALLASAILGSILYFSGVLSSSSSSVDASDRVQTSWYPSGQVQSRAELEEGVREGPASEWYANGQERCSGQYRRGLREGTWLFYTESGAIDEERSGIYAAGERTAPR